MAEKKMYLVKREVIANNIREAMNGKGKIYCVELAEDKFQENIKIGFDKIKNKKDAS